MVVQTLIVVDGFYGNGDDMAETARDSRYAPFARTDDEKHGIVIDDGAGASREHHVQWSVANQNTGGVCNFFQRFLAQKIVHWSSKYYTAPDGRRNTRNGAYVRVVHESLSDVDTVTRLCLAWEWGALLFLDKQPAAVSVVFRDRNSAETTTVEPRFNRLVLFRTMYDVELVSKPSASASTCHMQLFAFDLYMRRMIDAPTYYRRLDLITKHHVHDVMSHDFCDRVRAAAETWADTNGGWTTRRHSRYPTTDVPVAELPLNAEVRAHIVEHVFPLLAEHYALPTSDMSLNDLFVVKYTPAADGGQAELGWHRDVSFLSFNISLSHADEFEGGGTHFSSTGAIVRIDKGQAIMHSGQVYHAGAPVTKGARYILVAFVPVANAAIDHEFLRAAASSGACDADVLRDMYLY